ncbi:hypothetical protein MKX01_002269 [Papaver californicum]|nr:hypothetical protein MKX01_002269 [Papaver californicum]
MSTPSRKRFMRDFKRLQQDPPAGISGAPQDKRWNNLSVGLGSLRYDPLVCIVSNILSLQDTFRFTLKLCYSF